MMIDMTVHKVSYFVNSHYDIADPFIELGCFTLVELDAADSSVRDGPTSHILESALAAHFCQHSADAISHELIGTAVEVFFLHPVDPRLLWQSLQQLC